MSLIPKAYIEENNCHKLFSNLHMRVMVYMHNKITEVKKKFKELPKLI